MFKQYKDTNYDIYDDGRCYSHYRNRFLKPKMSDKYPSYSLTINGKNKSVKIHRMVAETFIPNPESKPIVNHIDGDTHNFHYSNLEWVTYKENSRHAVDTGLRPNGDQTINKYIANLPNEEWLPVKDFPNYVISSKGRIMNIKTKRILKNCKSNSGGYYEVNLYKQNKGHTTRIHTLVYTHFYNDFDLDGYVINHIDGNKNNNNKENLEKVTYTKNLNHALYTIKTNPIAKSVNQLDIDGNFIKTYPSISEAKRQTGINNISRAIHNSSMAGGFKWEFSSNK